MLKRPTGRRRSEAESVNINLVPMLDAMITIIGFMLYTTTFFIFVGVETLFPVASTQQQQEKLKEKPLQLTLSIRDRESEIWTPFNKFASITIPNLDRAQPDLIKIHEALLRLKDQFPKESTIVIAPSAELTYETIMALMDAIRQREKTDAPFFIKNEKTGVDEESKLLFSNVVFGNLLGG